METSIQIRTFLRSVSTTKVFQTLSKYSQRLKRTLLPQSPVLPVSLPSTNSSIVNQEVHTATARVPLPDQQITDQPEEINWAMIVIGFCMESAVDIALQSMQNRDHESSAFHLLSLLILFTSTALSVAKFIRPKFGIGAQVLEGVGIMLAVSAFCYAVSIPFPFALKCTTWATFGISVLAVLMCKYCF